MHRGLFLGGSSTGRDQVLRIPAFCFDIDQRLNLLFHDLCHWILIFSPAEESYQAVAKRP